MEKICSFIINLFFILLIIFLYVCSILYSYFVISVDFVSYIIEIFGIIAIIFYIFLSIKYNKFKIWNIFFLLFSFLLFLSYHYAFDQRVALKGFYGSREGLFVILSYYSFFLLATMVKKDKLRNIIFIILTICGILNVLYGFLQVINCQFVFGIPVTRKWSVASGFLFNPDFMGTYMIIMVGLWLPKYLLDNTNNKGTFLLTLLFVFGILICGTMGALLTLVLIVIMLILYCFFIRRKKINLGLVCKKFIFLFVSFFILFNIVSVINDNYSNDVSNLKYELKNTLSGNIDNSFGTGRIYIWKEAFKYFSNYIYTGIGIDNFAYLGYNYGTLIYDSPSRDNPVYKAHNEFFQILFTEGIFTFATYLLFMLLIFVLSLKKVISIDNDYDVLVSFFIVFCAYLIQSFFNIRILFIAPIFFMITGFLISDVTNKKVL